MVSSSAPSSSIYSSISGIGSNQKWSTVEKNIQCEGITVDAYVYMQLRNFGNIMKSFYDRHRALQPFAKVLLLVEK